MSSTIQAEFKALQDHQKLLSVLIFSLITVVIWVIASVIRSQRTATIEPELLILGAPLNPSINVEVLSQIEQKRTFSEAELNQFPIFVRRTKIQESSPFSNAAPASPSPGSALSIQPNTSSTSGSLVFPSDSTPQADVPASTSGSGLVSPSPTSNQ